MRSKESGKYIPRKCSISSKIINNKDHSSVQISIGVLDDGKFFKGEYDLFAFSGLMRKKGQTDYALVCLVDSLDRVYIKD
mmetsp:Transcript_25371/g.57155  ORF Transcript_25371/g.57155 Transcript_25371/m.57155 type:complete len:80 (-) Transcript_25371:137-376(-)